MSHALLLRLFLSPSFFSVHIALRYLKIYSDNIGITYYLTRRLRELDTQELRDVWGFICHLLVTRPSKSRALECFVIEVSERSTHIAMTTLWFMQAALKDLALSPHDSQSFLICQRTLHKCHEIIFGDIPPPAPTPYAGLTASFQTRLTRRKVKHHVEPVLIGIGSLLAGVPGMPKLTEIMGEVAIEQGRVEKNHGNEFRSIEMRDDEFVLGIPPEQDKPPPEDEETDDDDQKESLEESHGMPNTGRTLNNEHNRGHDRLRGHRRTLAAQTVPALPLRVQPVRQSRLSEDPLGQLDAEASVPVTIPYQSSPSLSSFKEPLWSTTVNAADTLLRNYDTTSQIRLLRSQYCRSEVQFLLSLESISNRLLVIPRPARVSALRAELTALNHKLPAEVCMPMWCSSSDKSRSDGTLQPHHRIVRIPPGESVVLNSAERAPYVLLIEILNDDLDFDPNKRSNKEVLKRIVIKEDQRRGASRDLISFRTSVPTNGHKPTSVYSNGIYDTLDMEHTVPPATIPPTLLNSSTVVGEEEEIDLVEQLYGSDQPLSSRAVDLSDSIMLPPPPKNKELDMATWSRSSSVPGSPAIENSSSISRNVSLSIPSIPFGKKNITHSPSPLHVINTLFNDPEGVRTLSLDEYSERMRTAAIMLAQLNANLVREPVALVPTSGISTSAAETRAHSGPLSWIPGSDWFTIEPPANRTSAQVPWTGGRTSNDSLQNVSTRIRLQHSEAAAIRDRIMKEMLSLEEERMDRMREHRDGDRMFGMNDISGSMNTAEDEGIIRRELNKVDPSAAVFSESWAAKKSRIRHGSPYGHLANWDCVSVIVKTGGDLRQEQLAVQLIQEFDRIWKEENCSCWVKYFRILITGGTSGLVETITDAVSIHSIKKAEYARRLAEGRLGHVTLFDHFKQTYGDPSSAKFARAQRNFAKSLAGYSVVTYLLQIKDRHNGNILLDRDGHLIHIDFGFMLSNSPGNIGFEAAPFKLPPEYIEVLGSVDGEPFREFRRLFREGFEVARKHCDRIITLVELMQKDSTLPCFFAAGEQTANQLRDRFQPALTHSLVGEYVERLIDSSLNSNWTRLYDSYQYYSQSIL